MMDLWWGYLRVFYNMKRQTGYDFLVKLLIIGNSGVGKTNLLLRFCEDSFQTSHLSTIGIDFKTKSVSMGNARVKLQIWDTAGQERFKTITQTYYRGAMGIVLTYAIDDRASFNDIENWVKQIKMHASGDVVKVLVGNKCDSEKRQVAFDQGKKLAKQLGIQFFQTSAKENINVNEMFMKVGIQAKRAIDEDKGAIGKGSDVGTARNLLTRNDLEKPSKQKKCC